ncbi:MAG TPA: hypothetical protein VMW66_00105, partial [Elusimicrobiales bacterium]|nr:hypothetical protein [Elusimicrobiales bacterium]
TLHDYIASTVVVKVRQRTGFSQGLTLALSLGLMALLAVLWGYMFFYRFSPQSLGQIKEANIHLRYLSRIQQVHKKRYGFYTDNLYRLSAMSGDPDLFKKRLLYAFEKEGFVIGADENHYYMSARAKDWGKTQVKITGP